MAGDVAPATREEGAGVAYDRVREDSVLIYLDTYVVSGCCVSPYSYLMLL
jgi:hypothetical protein